MVPFSGKYSTKCSQVMQNPARSTQVVESQRPHPSEILNSLIFMTRTNTSQGTILSLQIESSRKQRFITFEKIQSMSSASRLLSDVSKKKTNDKCESLFSPPLFSACRSFRLKMSPIALGIPQFRECKCPETPCCPPECASPTCVD